MDRDKTTYKKYGLLPLRYKEIIDHFECFVLYERTETGSETAIITLLRCTVRDMVLHLVGKISLAMA